MSGVENIITMIEQKTSEKVDKIIQNANEYKAAKLEKAEKDAKKIQEEIIANAKREANALLKRYESNTKLKAKQQILDIKNKLITEMLDKTIEKAKSIPKEKKYPKVLQQLIIEGARALEEPELELVVPEGQKKHIDLKTITQAVEKTTGKKIKFTIANETIRASGGVIIRTSDNTRWVDNTIEARIERFERDMREAIATILFSSAQNKN